MSVAGANPEADKSHCPVPPQALGYVQAKSVGHNIIAAYIRTCSLVEMIRLCGYQNPFCTSYRSKSN